jgi:hypothetical protein
VLDYSKINSFERADHHQGILHIPGRQRPSLTDHLDTISNELYQDTNVALLCEDIVNGMIAANEFRGPVSVDPSNSTSTELLSRSHRPHNFHHPPLEVIVDIEKRDWDFNVQPGMWLHPPLVVDRKAGLVFHCTSLSWSTGVWKNECRLFCPSRVPFPAPC